MSLEQLRERHQELLKLYREHVESLKEIQNILIAKYRDSSTDESNTAKAWLQDTGSLFRLLKRERYSNDRLPKAIDNTLSWRLKHQDYLLVAQEESDDSHFVFQSLPSLAVDYLEHPIVIVKMGNITGTSDELKASLILSFERLRLQLQTISANSGAPVLQYLWIVDVIDNSTALTSLVSDILPWLLREIQPHYHGLCAGVCIMNYSWLYSGLWTVAKRLLPQSILDKISFVSQSELLERVPRTSLPPEYGGTLGIHPPHRSHERPPPEASILLSSESPLSPSKPERPRKHVRFSRTSSQNPYFGYPTRIAPSTRNLTGNSQQPPRHFRDLILTLLLLYYVKWRRRLLMVLGISLAVVFLRWRRSFTQIPIGIRVKFSRGLGWKSFLLGKWL